MMSVFHSSQDYFRVAKYRGDKPTSNNMPNSEALWLNDLCFHNNVVPFLYECMLLRIPASSSICSPHAGNISNTIYLRWSESFLFFSSSVMLQFMKAWAAPEWVSVILPVSFVVLNLRLEESSAALCAQMERLEQEMEQEKKKQRMLEIKLRNSERAREDAENRNRLLEKEMEDFFSTLGDLALGARTSDIWYVGSQNYGCYQGWYRWGLSVFEHPFQCIRVFLQRNKKQNKKNKGAGHICVYSGQNWHVEMMVVILRGVNVKLV